MELAKVTSKGQITIPIAIRETLIKAFPAPDLRRKAAYSKKEALLLFANTVRICQRL